MSDRFVQARRLDLGPVAVEDLEQALQQVAQAHPMLRTRVDTSSAFAHFVGAEGDGPMVVRALDVDALIDHIDIAAGRSVVLGCVDGYVKAVAHHAVIDSASWMILEDDLRDALAGAGFSPGRRATRIFACKNCTMLTPQQLRMPCTGVNWLRCHGPSRTRTSGVRIM